MTDPRPNVSNVADGSAAVGAQAQVIHGGVYTYYIRPDATAKEKYELGIKYLNSRVPSLALSWIERAIAEGHHDTSEVRFHWLLALLSGRTFRQLSSEDNDRLDFLRGHHAVRQNDPWADGLRAILRLLDTLRSPGTDPASFIDGLEHLPPAQKVPLLQHVTVFLRGPKGDQIWQRDVEAADEGRYAKERDKRARYFFFPTPAEAFPRQPRPASLLPGEHPKAIAASGVFVLTLLYIGWELISHVSVLGILGCVADCGGTCLASADWLNACWRARQADGRPLSMSLRDDFFPPPEDRFRTRVDQRFDWYLHLYAPKTGNTDSWIYATADTRAKLRDEIVEIYRGRQVKAKQLNWLIGHEVRQLVHLWKEGTLRRPLDGGYKVRPAALLTGTVVTAVGLLLAAVPLISMNPLEGSIALLVLVLAGYQGASRWIGITLEQRRAMLDQAESERKFAERAAAYETWRNKLTTLQPSDREMAEWLECDKKTIVKLALRHYGLKRSDLISYAFLETPSGRYERASVRNGPGGTRITRSSSSC